MTNVDLIADVGGTNIRLAVVINQRIEKIECFECADFSSLEEVALHYIKKNSFDITSACFAIAGPATGTK